MTRLIHALLIVFALTVLARPAFGQAQPEMTIRELFAIMNERDRANNQRFDAQEKAIAAALAAVEKGGAAALAAAKEAVSKQESASEKRFESVNEFRNTLKDQQANLLTRNEAAIKFDGLEQKLRAIELRQNQETGRSEGAAWLWGIMIAVGGLAVGAFAAFIRFRPAPT